MQAEAAPTTWFSDEDFYYWNEGSHHRSYTRLGAHPVEDGTWFATWAPWADSVSVIGEFNDWNPDAAHLERTEAGLWVGFIGGVHAGHRYKLRIRRGDYQADKADPYAFALEPPAGGGSAVQGLSSIVTRLDDYTWNDDAWMRDRPGPTSLHRPLSFYEVHLGSWKHKKAGESLSYREIAEPLADHVERLGFTHIELMPLSEHPYYGSWGYQIVGYYAPTFRYGSPHDLMYLIDVLHQRGIGVIMDWVPGHFATDPQGLVFFDGSTLYEYDDERMRFHPDWGSYIFDYNKPGVRNFLTSNALFWLDQYHIDGLRVDAVASMLYRDYSRGNDWTPNMFGGRENLEAIDFIKKTNEAVFTHYPQALMVAEESTAWGGVSAPTYNDGLGFLYKWNMGWMHDTLKYMSEDPVHRKYHHNDLTFSMIYAFAENFVLPLSHDEVVHGKGSLWGKMPGDTWQKAANLRLLYAHMYGHPGKKLLFMGSELGEWQEWAHDREVNWQLLDTPHHGGIMEWVSDLNHFYREHRALWYDGPGSFEWVVVDDAEQSVAAYLRKNGDDQVLWVLNFTPVPRTHYRLGVPAEGVYREVLNSDAERYGGGGVRNDEDLESTPVAFHGRPASIVVTLPPLGMIALERVGDAE